MSPRRARRPLWRAVLILSLFCLGLLSLGASAAALAPAAQAHGSRAASASSSSSLPYVRDLDSPAVVRIVSEVDAQVICSGCSSSGSDYVFPSTQQVYPVEFSGSGAFISSDGYILTADHVVDLNCSDNEYSILQYWQSDVQTNYQNYGFSDSASASQFTQSALNNNLLSVQCQNSSFSQVFPSSAYTGSLSSPSALVGYKVAQIVQSSPPDKQDTAIVKIDAPHDMPYLTLAKQTDVQTGESITAIAYPGDADQADFGILLNPAQSNTDVNTVQNLISPSIDSGQITATQTLSDGTLTYETAGIAYHGSSGGPAVDDQGRIVGFFDYLTNGSASASQRVSVMIASAIAANYAQQAGVATPRAGTVEPLWSRAMNEYYASGPCHYGNAYSDLNQLHTLHPEFGGVQSFLLNAQQKQTPAACKASLQTGPSPLLIVLLILILLALVGGALFYFLVLRRRAPQPAMAPVVAGGASTGWPTPATGPGSYPGQFGAPGAGQPTMPGAYNPTSGQFTPAPGAPPAPATQQQSGPPAQPFTPAPQQYTPPAQPFTPAPQPAMPTPQPYVNPAQPATPAPVPPTPVSAVQRLCVNGHVVHDPTAHFCPECGAAIQNPPTTL